jgi:adenylate cyclase
MAGAGCCASPARGSIDIDRRAPDTGAAPGQSRSDVRGADFRDSGDTSRSFAALARAVFRPADHASLPPRVRDHIRQEQMASEILVGWIQLGVVLFMAVLYAISPKTFSADTMFAPVPWALGAYISFTVLRLGLAYRRLTRPWFGALSCLVDVALLISLIWSFHIQYEQPPAFVLKSPTLIYLFVFIALRALLLEPRLVMLTGLAGAVGWLMVVSAVLLTDQRPGLVTRSYVEYLTSNHLLVGAELDKIVAIVLATGLVAVAMLRARRLLVRSVAEGVRARDLARFFSPEVADRITSGERELTPGRGENRDAAILYVDIRDFTTITAAMPPDELIALLAEYQARLIPPILAYDGSTEKYLGDGMMASFGAIAWRATYAADALRAAEGILSVCDAWNAERRAAGEQPLDVRAAITAGRVVVGAVGGESRLEYAVVGFPVNLAAKLEKHAKVEGVRALCTRMAFERALAQGWSPTSHSEVRPRRSVAGVSEPVDLVVLAP